MAIVVIKNVAIERQAARAAVHSQVAIPAIGILAGLGSRGEIEFHVIGNENIQPPVFVIVEKCAACVVAVSVLLLAGFRRYVFEAPAVDVAIERQTTPGCDEQIGEAVIIEIAGANALAPAVAR